MVLLYSQEKWGFFFRGFHIYFYTMHGEASSILRGMSCAQQGAHVAKLFGTSLLKRRCSGKHVPDTYDEDRYKYFLQYIVIRMEALAAGLYLLK